MYTRRNSPHGLFLALLSPARAGKTIIGFWFIFAHEQRIIDHRNHHNHNNIRIGTLGIRSLPEYRQSQSELISSVVESDHRPRRRVCERSERSFGRPFVDIGCYGVQKGCPDNLAALRRACWNENSRFVFVCSFVSNVKWEFSPSKELFFLPP